VIANHVSLNWKLRRLLLSLPTLVFLCLTFRSEAQTCQPPSCWSGNFYQYQIVAQTSQTTSVGTLTALGVGPSINDIGTVAFSGQVSNAGTVLGNTIFLGDPGSTSVTVVAPSFLNAKRNFDQAVQINSGNQIIAQDRFAGAPPSYYLRVWDGNKTDSFTLVAEATGSNKDVFAAILTAPTINSSNDVAFSALDLKFNQLLADTSLTPPPPFNTTALSTPLRPMIADPKTPTDFPIVVRGGNTDTSPILLYRNNLQKPVIIADSLDFSALGQSPSISRDGVVVAFAGDLKLQGTKGANAWDKYPGPGIFVAVLQNGVVTYRLRVAGFHYNSMDGIKRIFADKKTGGREGGLTLV
jgi:hypothetical protein